MSGLSAHAMGLQEGYNPEQWGPWKSHGLLLQQAITELGWQENAATLIKVFKEHSHAKEGCLSREEFVSIMQRYPCCNTAYHTVFFDLFDRNQDGYLNESDFLGGILAVSPLTPHKLDAPSGQLRMQFIFLFYDANRNGRLETDEVAKMFEHIQQLRGQPHSDATVDATALVSLYSGPFGFAAFYDAAQKRMLNGTSPLLRTQQDLLEAIWMRQVDAGATPPAHPPAALPVPSTQPGQQPAAGVNNNSGNSVPIRQQSFGTPIGDAQSSLGCSGGKVADPPLSHNRPSSADGLIPPGQLHARPPGSSDGTRARSGGGYEDPLGPSLATLAPPAPPPTGAQPHQLPPGAPVPQSQVALVRSSNGAAAHASLPSDGTGPFHGHYALLHAAAGPPSLRPPGPGGPLTAGAPAAALRGALTDGRVWGDTFAQGTASDASAVALRVVRRLMELSNGLRTDWRHTLQLVTVREMMLLCDTVVEILRVEDSLVQVPLPCRVYGDIHGQLLDLLEFFNAFSWPDKRRGDIFSMNYVFLGDFVDRGNYSCDVIALLFSLKILYPMKVFLVRGNHEDRLMNVNYGFLADCVRKFAHDGHDIWERINDVFEFLPIAALVERVILCIHGGIGDSITSLDDLSGITKPIEVVAEITEATTRQARMILDALWSDPTDNDSVLGVHVSPRGKNTCRFGPDRVQDFNRRNGLKLIIRGHECVQHGYEYFAQGQLLTVFSATNYCNQYNNDGAMVVLVKDDRTGEVVEHAQVIKSGTVDTSYGWNESQFRAPSPMRRHGADGVTAEPHRNWA